MSTEELQKKLRELGKSDQGSRGILIRRYEKYADLEDQEEVQADVEREGEGNRQAPHASERLMMVMVVRMMVMAMVVMVVRVMVIVRVIDGGGKGDGAVK